MAPTTKDVDTAKMSTTNGNGNGHAHDELDLALAATGSSSGSDSDDSSSDDSSSDSGFGSQHNNTCAHAPLAAKIKTKTTNKLKAIKAPTALKLPSLPQFKRRGGRVGSGSGRAMKRVKNVLWDWKCLTILLILLLTIMGGSIYEFIFRKPLATAKANKAAAAEAAANPQTTTPTNVNVNDTLATVATDNVVIVDVEDYILDEWVAPIAEKVEWQKGRSLPNDSTRTRAALELLETFSYDDMLTGSTAQNEAAYWMLAKDKAALLAAQSDSRDVRFVQRYTLATMYHALQGDDWQYLDEDDSTEWGDQDVSSSSSRTKWLDSSGNHECQWWGVSCNSGNRITKINLNGMNLNGHLPPEVAYLKTLEELDLYRNQLEGRMPDLPDTLTYLDVERNHFTGPIPESLWYAYDLRKVFLSDNQFTGTLSTRMGRLTKLEDFRAWHNKLQGQIPTTVGQMTSMRKLLIQLQSVTVWLCMALWYYFSKHNDGLMAHSVCLFHHHL
jgi:hypothetical protein